MKKTLAYMLSFVLLPAAVLLTAQAGDVENSLFSEKDLILATMEEATPIVLNGESVTISEEGVYVLSGEIANGGIRISLQEEGIVRLLLNGVSVRNASGAALYTENCKKVILTLAQGTVNTFSQTGADAQDEAVNAAIYSRDDLTVNGTGALVVEGGYQDGGNSRDTLKIVSGQVSVTARDDGLVGKDAVIVGGGTLSVTSASGDGVKATNTEEAGRGYVMLAGGDISIKTGGGSAAVVKSNQNAGRGGGPGFTAKDTTSSESSSMKGVKAATLITLSGANITVDSEDDAIHSNGDIEMTAGTLTLSTGDDGMHADAALRISGGEISITEAYEGVEATDITLSGGRVAITAADDGINGAGGDSGVQTDVGWGGEWGRHGRDMFSSSTGTLTVSVKFSWQGDGLMLHYTARCDQDTILNLTNHSYFNLDGEGTVQEQLLKIHADHYTPNDAGCLPTGELAPVAGTAMDFRSFKPIGKDADSDEPCVKPFRGYDVNFCLDGSIPAIEAKSLKSGIVMCVTTDQPGVQLFTANHMKERIGKNGQKYGHRSAFCLETQHFPDCIHHPDWPSCVLRAGEVFDSKTIYSFTTE